MLCIYSNDEALVNKGGRRLMPKHARTVYSSTRTSGQEARIHPGTGEVEHVDLPVLGSGASAELGIERDGETSRDSGRSPEVKFILARVVTCSGSKTGGSRCSGAIGVRCYSSTTVPGKHNTYFHPGQTTQPTVL